MHCNIKQLAKFLFRVLVSIGLLTWVFTQIDLQKFWQTIKASRWLYLIAFWAVVGMSYLIQSIKMKFILRKQGCRVSIGTFFGISTIEALYALVLPGVLSQGLKWYLLKKNTGKGSSVFCGLAYNQLSEMMARMVCALTILMVTNPAEILFSNVTNRWLLPIACGVLLVIIFLIYFLLLNRSTGGMVIKSIAFLLRLFPTKVYQGGQKLLEQIVVLQRLRYRFHFFIGLFTITFFLLINISSFTLATMVVNVAIPVSVYVWLAVLIYCLGRIPISVANLGVREVTMVGVLAAYGVEKSAALFISMMFFSASVFFAIIGGIFQVYWGANLKEFIHSPNRLTA